MGGHRSTWIALFAVLTLSCGSSGPGNPEADDAGDAFPVPPEPPPVAWAACTEPDLEGLDCATMKVPLDYEHPDEEQIELALARAPATDPAHRLGSLLHNPGGPGASGRSWTVTLRDRAAKDGFPLSVFDLVGFDPRGVGASTPVVDCGPPSDEYIVDWTPDDDGATAALEAAMRDYAAACTAHSGKILPFMDSYSVARDMDQIRRALREDDLTYYGSSYGTVIGTAYAALFPDRVRAMVLDAAFAPDLDGPGYLERASARESAFEEQAASCDARPDCTARFAQDGGDMRAAFDRAVRQMTTTPLVDPATGDAMNDSMLAVSVAGQFFAPPPNPFIEAGIEAAAQGDGGLFHGAIEEAKQPSSIVPLHCADLAFPDPAEAFGTLLPALRSLAPRFGHADLREILPCAYWPTPPRPHPTPRATGAPPILVIGGTRDHVVPYAWSERLAATLDSGVLLTRDASGHTAYSAPSQCVSDAVKAYLVELKVPAEGTVCTVP